ncbi:MAG: hypothetical protein N4A76_08555 [Firmicutes bacterium]|jgi:transposase-like protein|nr:hypothetical protein [Bacillota bacterium]
MGKKERLIQSLNIIDQEISRLVKKRRELEKLLEKSSDDKYKLLEFDSEYINILEEVKEKEQIS